jgi:hypothetical protein
MHSSVFSLKITVVSNENLIDCYLQCPFAHHDTDMLEPFQQQVMEIYKRHCDYIVNAEYLPVRTAWFYDVTMVDSLAIIDMGDESVGLWPQAFGVNCPFLLDKADPDDKNRFRVAMRSLYAEYTECIRVNSFFSDEREDSGVQRVFGKPVDPG